MRYNRPTASELREAGENRSCNDSGNASLHEIIAMRLSRRDVLGAGVAAGALSLLAPLAGLSTPAEADAASSFDFPEIAHGADATHHLAGDHRAQVLLRWGDPVLPGAPAFDPAAQTLTAQERQFGYNNDFIGFVPLPHGSNSSVRGLLCVNHEYTNEEVMFPGLGNQNRAKFKDMTAALVGVEMAAHGATIIEIARDAGGQWAPVAGSRHNRRITAMTPMAISGPAAGHTRLRTAADPTGAAVLGTINNCAGGITPWGSYLMAEENFNFYFSGEIAGHAEERNYKRYGVPGNGYGWAQFHDRFDINKEPNEPNRFGWIVEVDPLDSNAVPVKRTALGRFKHEGTEPIVNADGRLVIYMGDDQRFDYLYRFVSAGRVNMSERAANATLLDSGVLSVARFDADGGMTWLPLSHGQGPLTAANGFASQADVLIETRRAADLLGATKMDRPEDVQPNPATGKVYVLATNNTKRKVGDENPANPRADNAFGHIIELAPPAGDHTAEAFKWDILVRCGDPARDGVGAVWNPATSRNGWFAAPDNCAVDALGRVWIATDQGSNWVKSGTADGIWALETEGPLRGTGRMLFRAPVGAEVCGPAFTPDGSTLFLAVQHPGVDGARHYPGFGRDSTFEDPATRWPDFQDGVPPRPSVLAITRTGGGRVG